MLALWRDAWAAPSSGLSLTPRSHFARLVGWLIRSTSVESLQDMSTSDDASSVTDDNLFFLATGVFEANIAAFKPPSLPVEICTAVYETVWRRISPVLF